MSPWKRWQDWAKVVLGAWLFLTPWILGFALDASASWNAWIAGLVLALIGIWALAAPGTKALEWVAGVAGAWVFFSPWILAFVGESGAAWNAWVVGLITAGLAVWSVVGSEKTSAAA